MSYEWNNNQIEKKLPCLKVRNTNTSILQIRWGYYEDLFIIVLQVLAKEVKEEQCIKYVCWKEIGNINIICPDIKKYTGVLQPKYNYKKQENSIKRLVTKLITITNC